MTIIQGPYAKNISYLQVVVRKIRFTLKYTRINKAFKNAYSWDPMDYYTCPWSRNGNKSTPPIRTRTHQISGYKNIQKLYIQSQTNEHHNIHAQTEKRLICQTKEKLISNNAVLVKANKGNTLIIEFQNSYQNKIQTFISNNNFMKIDKDPTKKYQNSIRTSINKCQQIINKDTKWNYINLNPTPPNIWGHIKIHKNNNPIRPIVNWTNAPAYKLAKKSAKDLQKYIPLPYAFNVKNSIHLMKDLLDIPYDNNIKLASFDIMNMYTNIPTDELLNIIQNLCSINYINTTTHSLTHSLAVALETLVGFWPHQPASSILFCCLLN